MFYTLAQRFFLLLDAKNLFLLSYLYFSYSLSKIRYQRQLTQLLPSAIYNRSKQFKCLYLSFQQNIQYGIFGYGGHQQQKPASRDMDCIIEPVNGKGGLYLGNIKAASNTQYLQQHRIGAVLTGAIESNVHYDHSIIPYHMIVEGYDVEQFDLEDYFDEASKFIHDSLAVTNTLVHCMAGISRSTTLLIAYLVRYRGMKSDDALNYVRSRRSIVNPNPGFWSQLKQYEKILYKRKARGSGAQMPMQNNQIQKPITANNNYGYNQGNGGNFLYTQPMQVQPAQQMGYEPYGFGGFF